MSLPLATRYKTALSSVISKTNSKFSFSPMRTAYPVPVSRLQAFGPAVGPLLGVCNNVNVHGTEPVRMAQYILSLFNVTFISHV